MKKILSTLLGVLCFYAVLAQDPARVERIASSYMLAFGRQPSPAEINYWNSRKDANSISDFVRNHKTYIGQDVGTKRMVIVKAYNDAMGRNPTAAEISYWSAGNNAYFELMKNHLQWLSGNRAEYDNVIKRSYQFALHRQPNPAELQFWERQGTLSYIVLVGCHEDWLRRNGAAAQKTAGANTIAAGSPYVSLLTISPAVANEAKSFSGLLSTNGGNVIAAGGGNVIAAGGGNVIAAGGGNVIAAGGGN